MYVVAERIAPRVPVSGFTLTVIQPDGRRTEDGYRDEGCRHHPACLTCPFPRCIVNGGSTRGRPPVLTLAAAGQAYRDRFGVRRSRGQGVDTGAYHAAYAAFIRTLAGEYGVSEVTAYRRVKEARRLCLPSRSVDVQQIARLYDQGVPLAGIGTAVAASEKTVLRALRQAADEGLLGVRRTQRGKAIAGAVTLLYRQGYPIAEIAERLDARPGTVMEALRNLERNGSIVRRGSGRTPAYRATSAARKAAITDDLRSGLTTAEIMARHGCSTSVVSAARVALRRAGVAGGVGRAGDG